MNKKLIISIVVLLQLLFVWRCIMIPASRSGVEVDTKKQEMKTEESAIQIQKNEQTDVMSGETLDFIRDFDELILQGQQSVEDTPWEINAGIIESEKEGKLLLLTPNTGIMTSYMDIAGKKFRMSFCIYEDVRNMSDGAGLLLQIHDGNGNLLKEENIVVDAERDWQSYECDLDESNVEAADIRLVCNNGGNDDDICDWVIIREAAIE